MYNNRVMTFKFIKLDDKYISELLSLSAKWEEENITNGYHKNVESDIEEPIVIAIDNNKIVGYCFGEFYIEKSTFSYIKPGSKCFRICEIYVLPEYRSQGIGKKIIDMLMDKVKNDCEYTVLSTSTKDYKKILKFYIDDVGMEFHSAFLIKKN